ncbi:MAG: hypothetical protein ACYDCC_12185 [Actinomycetota bacterium]
MYGPNWGTPEQELTRELIHESGKRRELEEENKILKWVFAEGLYNESQKRRALEDEIKILKWVLAEAIHKLGYSSTVAA